MNQEPAIFAYIHYRVFRFFERRRDPAPEFASTLILSLMQCFTVLVLLVALEFFLGIPLPNKWLMGVLLAIAVPINWYVYERNFDPEKLALRWKDESWERHILSGWLISLYLAFCLLTPIIYGILKVNLGVISPATN